MQLLLRPRGAAPQLLLRRRWARGHGAAPTLAAPRPVRRCCGGNVCGVTVVIPGHVAGRVQPAVEPGRDAARARVRRA